MAEIFVSDYIAKLALLEKAVGHKVSYRLLEPFSLRGLESANRYIEIQSAAKQIAEFAGLGQTTFVVEAISLGQKTSGKIELGSGSREVFIQLSNDLFGFPEAILATLSHEITHKFLEINRVSWGEGLANHYHNEVLTDIAAIFLGLGKLMLNGHNLQRTTTDGSCEVTHTQRVGYLDGAQLAFVYLFTCHMRGIPSHEFEKGLSFSSLRLLGQCSAGFAQYFQPDFRNPEEGDVVREQMALSLQELKRRTDRFAEAIREARDAFNSLERKTLERSRIQKEILSSASQQFENVEVDPCLRYISTLQHAQFYLSARGDIEAVSSEIDAAAEMLRQSRQCLTPRTQSRPSFIQGISRLFMASKLRTANTQPLPKTSRKQTNEPRARAVHGYRPSYAIVTAAGVALLIGALLIARFQGRDNLTSVTRIDNRSGIDAASSHQVHGSPPQTVGGENKSPSVVMILSEEPAPPEPKNRLSKQNRPPSDEVLSPEGSTSEPNASLPNGARIAPDIGIDGHGELNVDNGTAEDAEIILYNVERDEKTRDVNAKAHNPISLPGIPVGTYRLKYKLGDACYQFDRILDYTEQQSEREDREGVTYKEISVTLHPVVGGNVRTTKISLGDFLKGHPAARPFKPNNESTFPPPTEQ